LRLRGLFVLIVVLATAGFAVGIAIERATADGHTDETATHEEAIEGGHEEGGDEATAEPTGGETVLGLNLESTPLVVAAVVGSLLLAGAVWARPRSRPLLAFAALAMLAFPVLDVAEVLHQLDESREGVGGIATFVAALHLAAVGAAGTMVRASQ
jgi:hypothetical protein